MHNEQNKGMKEKGSEELKLKDKIIVVTKVLLDVMFYAGIMVCISLPISIKFYGKFNSYFKNNHNP